MKTIKFISLAIVIYSLLMSTSELYCLTFEYNTGIIVNKSTPEKPRITFIEKAKYGNSKLVLKGVNSISNDGKYLILCTESGLLRLNKKDFRVKRITKKIFDKIVIDRSVYWMIGDKDKSERNRLIKYCNGKFRTMGKEGSSKEYELLKTGDNNGAWIIEKITKDTNKNKMIVRNTQLNFKRKVFETDAEIFDCKTDNKGSLWIASSKGIYELIITNRNKVILNKFDYIIKKLQIINNSDTIHFINNDTLYCIQNGNVIFKEYRKGINNSIYVNGSYIRHLENISNDENECKSGILEIKSDYINIFNDNGLINDTVEINKIIRKENKRDNYTENVSAYKFLPNGDLLYVVYGHGRAEHCYDGVYFFDGTKVIQIIHLNSGEEMLLEKNKVWVPDGSDWHMVSEGVGGGLYMYEY